MQCVEDCDSDHPVLYEQPVWQTLQMFRESIPHVSSPPSHPPFKSERCSVSLPRFLLCSVYPFEQGFLPVIYTWFRSRRQSSVQLPEDLDDPLVPNKLVPEPQQLSGSKILLLWIPAACDLTGTTVRCLVYLHPPLSITLPAPLVNEYRPVVHSRFDLSNDPRRFGPIRRSFERYISPPPSLALPVRH